MDRFNRERPYQALDMATPASRYTPSARPYQRRKINLSQVFAGQKVGVKQTAEHIWLVSFMVPMSPE